MDLNHLKIPLARDDDEDDAWVDLQQNNAESADQKTTVYFRDIQKRVIEHIQQADVVLGCVAWLTSFEVLKALQVKKGVSIIVQKEDFLRPDFNVSENDDYENWLFELKKLYQAVYPRLTRRDIGQTLAQMRDRAYRSLAEEKAREWNIEDGMDAIRCVGVSSQSNARSLPRMHNKFLIFAQWDGRGEVEPYAVWTGSYNLSANAKKSFENALVLRDKSLVDAYFSEYLQIACLSEPLDWKSEVANPEWWQGTTKGPGRYDPLAGEF